MSSLLNEKCALAKLRAELEGRKGKLCQCCKKFGHMACNCRNKEGEEKETNVPQNKFEVLRSRVMQCGVEEKMIRRQEVAAVECFKCGEEGDKCKECLLWKQMKKAAHMATPQKMQQERRPACPIREKAQEGEKRLRRVEEDKAVHVTKPQEAQKGWKRSSVEELKKRVEEHCRKGVPEKAQLWDLG